MLDPARLKSTGVHWLRGEPRQCADRAHRLIPPSLAPTGERRPSMACLRPIPAPPRLSPPECPWLRRCRLRHTKRNVPPKRRTPWSRRTSMQGDFVRADRVCVEPGCTAPACWSRTRNHAADEIPLQRRPPPEAKLLPLQRRPRPGADAPALDLQRRPHAPQSGEQAQKRPGLPSRPFADAASRPLVRGSRRPAPGRLPRSPPRSGSGCSAGRRASRR